MARLIVDGVVEKMPLDGTTNTSFHVSVVNEITGTEVYLPVSSVDVGRLAALAQEENAATEYASGYTGEPEPEDKYDVAQPEPMLPFAVPRPESAFEESDDPGETQF